MRHYCGEYLVSPVGVHFGLNWCSHNCYYCFANLNQPKRRADFPEAMRTLRAAASDHETKNIGVNLLRAGHRILCANDSDPFAVSNVDAFLQVYEFARERDFLFAFQTRGGRDAMRVIQEHPPTWVYISMTGDNDEEVKLREPGSPSPGSRWELAAAAKEAGHQVCLGLNPFRPAWWKDTDALVRRAADLGIRHAWVGDLHLSRFQKPNISPKQTERHAAEIAYAMAKNKPDRGEAIMVGEALMEAGINIFEAGRSVLGDFWGDYETMTGVAMPTLDSLMARLQEESRLNGGKPVVFSFDWFDDWANALPDLRASAFKEYLQPMGRSIRNLNENQAAGSFREVHQFLWRVEDFPTHLGDDQLSWVTQGPEETAPIVTDEQDRPLMVWTPQRRPSAVLHVPEDDAVWLLEPDDEEETAPTS